jgi:hypothetical protein
MPGLFSSKWGAKLKEKIEAKKAKGDKKDDKKDDKKGKKAGFGLFGKSPRKGAKRNQDMKSRIKRRRAARKGRRKA